MRKAVILIVVTVLVIAIAVLAVVLYFALKSDSRTMTQCGEVEGEYDSGTGVYTYKGIPYAVPPVGSLRWKPPVTPRKEDGTCFEGVYKAREFGSKCPQIGTDLTDPEAMSGNEDCLFLDVFTPTNDGAAKLPVVVFIHGGSLLGGDSHGDGYAPNTDITKELNVVFVSIQYRLDALGFLVLDALKDRTGNYGLLDVIESLKWIQTNIENFGGDPNKVTVSGQSSGGTLVKALLLSPLAKGLIHRAWVSSGSIVLDGTYEEAATRSQFYLTKTGCSSSTCTTDQCLADCLYALPAETLLKATRPDGLAPGDGLPTPGQRALPLLVVDGDVIPYATFDAWNGVKKPQLPDVPVMMGSTAQETDFLPDPLYELFAWNQTTYEDYVSSSLQPFGANIAREALRLYPYTTDAEYSFTTITSDEIVNCGTSVVADAMAATLTSPVYLYVITAWPSSPLYAFGIPFPASYAMHGLDTFAFFRHWAVYFSEPPTEQDEKFADLFVNNMKSFILDGTPSPSWPSYPDATALIDETLTVSRTKYNEERCNFWMDNDFFQYGWMN